MDLFVTREYTLLLGVVHSLLLLVDKPPVYQQVFVIDKRVDNQSAVF